MSNLSTSAGSENDGDPLFWLWKAMQTSPSFSFDRMSHLVDRRFFWLKQFYPAEFVEFISLLTIEVLEFTTGQQDAVKSLSEADFNLLINKAAYQMRQSLDRLKRLRGSSNLNLDLLPGHEERPEDIVEREDLKRDLADALSRFDKDDLKLFDEWMLRRTDPAAKKHRGPMSDKKRKQVSRLLQEIRDFLAARGYNHYL